MHITVSTHAVSTHRCMSEKRLIICVPDACDLVRAVWRGGDVMIVMSLGGGSVPKAPSGIVPALEQIRLENVLA